MQNRGNQGGGNRGNNRSDDGRGRVTSQDDGRLRENQGNRSSDTRAQGRSDNRAQGRQQEGDGQHYNVDGSPDRRFQDNGQGDVLNPDTDMRLKENRDDIGGRSNNRSDNNRSDRNR